MMDMEDEEDGENGPFFSKKNFRKSLVHVGLILSCIMYIVMGAYLFKSIERPLELRVRKMALAKFEKIRSNLLDRAFQPDQNPAELVDEYMEQLFDLFSDPLYAHVFESHYTNFSTPKDMWTFSSAILFTTTTVIPVGYGYVTPISDMGKALLIAYGIVGIPLALVTMADTGKFISMIVTRMFKDQNMVIPTVIFLSLLVSYPLFGGILFNYYAQLSFLDAIYFSLISIFTIGFGDLTPDVNVLYLVTFIVVGVILVTITIDFVAAELIEHIHYLGRHVGNAKLIAGKMLAMAQNLNMNRGISGLTAGMSQLQALARMGLLGKLDKEALEKGEQVAAFAPIFEDMDFVDTASYYGYGSKADLTSSQRDAHARSLFLS